MKERKDARSTTIWSDLANQAFQRHFKLAVGYGSSQLEPEHLLVALVDLNGGVASAIFRTSGAEAAELKAIAEDILGPRPDVHPLDVGTPSERWNKILGTLFSDFPGISLVGTGHVLYAIVAILEKATPSSPILAYLKGKELTSESIKSQVDLEIEPLTRDSPHYDKSKMRLKRESPWGRTYEIAPKHDLCESKFQTGEAKVTLTVIREAWPKWTVQERIDFTNNYNCADASTLGEEDQRVIGYLIEQVSPEDRCLLSWMISRFYTNKKEAFEILSKWLQDDATENRSGLFECLAHLDAAAALPIMRKCLDAWLKKIDLEHFPEKPKWEQRAPYHECVTGAGVLYRLTEEAQYRVVLEKLSNFPDPGVKIVSNRDLKDVAERK